MLKLPVYVRLFWWTGKYSSSRFESVSSENCGKAHLSGEGFETVTSFAAAAADDESVSEWGN